MTKNKKNPVTCVKLVHKSNKKKLWLFGFLFLCSFPIVVVFLMNLEDILELIFPFVVSFGIFVISIINIIIAIRGQISLEDSNLGKCVLRHSKYERFQDVTELFENVDKDIQENGDFYKDIAIGNEWVLSQTVINSPLAAKLEEIKAVFYFNVKRGKAGEVKRSEYWIHVIDKDDNDTYFYFGRFDYMMKAYGALCEKCPNVTKGNQKDWINYQESVSFKNNE